MYKHTHTHTHTHTHSINLTSRLHRAGLYGFSCIAAREADLFFREAMQVLGFRNPPCPLRRGKGGRAKRRRDGLRKCVRQARVRQVSPF